MQASTEAIKKLIADCTPEEQLALRQYLSTIAPHPLEAEWSIGSDEVLSAIQRSSELTKSGIRGVIAEAFFETEVIPSVKEWTPVKLAGDLSYDALLTKGGTSARIQVKLQRQEKRLPKLYDTRRYNKGTLYVVEVQRTRTGNKKKRKVIGGSEAVEITVPEKTRPYKFDDFDILAVNMHPSCRDWKSFRFTVATWLIAKADNPDLIETMQPVSAKPNTVWTDDLSTCLNWFESGEKRDILEELLHLRKPAEIKPPIQKVRLSRITATKNIES